jgi:hypothetical protein
MARMARVDGSWRIEVRLGRRREAKAVEDAVRSQLGPTVGRDGRTVFADAGNWPQAEHMRTVVERVVAALQLEASVEVTREPNG